MKPWQVDLLCLVLGFGLLIITAIYEVTNYEIDTSDGTIIFTTSKSEKLKDGWGK